MSPFFKGSGKFDIIGFLCPAPPVSNVGPPFAYASSIMSFGARLFRIRAMIGRPPIMSFGFGGLRIRNRKDSQQSLLNQSTRTSEPWKLRRGVLRVPNFCFSEGPNVRRGGGASLKRVQH